MTSIPEPTPPTNVRVRLDDGTVIPCELAYEGPVDGVHRWLCVAPVAVPAGPVAVLCDVLPARTSIAVQFVKGLS